MDDAHGPILIDVTPGGDVTFDKTFFERIGHPVLVCHGPAGDEVCPVVAGEHCPMFEDAHGVVFELDLDKPQHRAILRRYRELARPDVPIRALVKEGQAEKYATELEGVALWDREPTVSELDGFSAEVDASDR